jgi:hypothetical protein
VVLSAAGSVYGVTVIAEQARAQQARQLIKEQLVAALKLKDGGEILLRDTPDPVYSPNLQMPELMAIRVRFPFGIGPSAEGRLRASAADVNGALAHPAPVL